jgi:cold-inducible RNA-binding protein
MTVCGPKVGTFTRVRLQENALQPIHCNEHLKRGKDEVMNIYVGNLSYKVTEEDLQQAFAGFGEVASAKVITDTATGRSKGFGFVEMPNGQEAEAAIQGLNGKEIKGRAINVGQAKPRAEGRQSGYGRGRGGPRRY